MTKPTNSQNNITGSNMGLFVPIPSSVEELIEKGLKFQRAVVPDYKKAIECYSQILQSNANHIGALNNRGTALAAQGYHDQALLGFDRILELEPNNVMALNNRGSTYLSQGDLTHASLDFERVLEREPHNDNALYNLDIIQKQATSSCCLIL